MRRPELIHGVSLPLLLLSMLGCADKLELRDEEPVERDSGAGELPNGLPGTSGPFEHKARRDGTIETEVDAISETDWQQLDLDTGRVSQEEALWDLAFSRFRIRLNGGLSGPGHVQVVALADQPFDALERAPEAGFGGERADSEGEEGDADSEPDNVFNAAEEDWYDYNVMTHELSPRDISYVVLSTESRYFKLRLESYYDSAGTPGLMRFHWAEIAPPEAAAADGGSGDD